MALEVETKGKMEAIRMKKKLESGVVELETALDRANFCNSESQREIKLIQEKTKVVQNRFEEEVRSRAAATDNLVAAERRVNANQNGLEEARSTLEQMDRSRSQVEEELTDLLDLLLWLNTKLLLDLSQRLSCFLLMKLLLDTDLTSYFC